MTTTIDDKAKVDIHEIMSKNNGFSRTSNEFAHKHSPLKLNAEYKKNGYSKKDSDGIAKRYHEAFYAPVMNLTNYACLR